MYISLFAQCPGHFIVAAANSAVGGTLHARGTVRPRGQAKGRQSGPWALSGPLEQNHGMAGPERTNKDSENTGRKASPEGPGVHNGVYMAPQGPTVATGLGTALQDGVRDSCAAIQQ